VKYLSIRIVHNPSSAVYIVRYEYIPRSKFIKPKHIPEKKSFKAPPWLQRSPPI